MTLNNVCTHSGGEFARISAARRRERAIVSGYSFRSFSGSSPLAIMPSASG